ncbi:MAG: methyltransferase domain-containing protein [Thiogranum sp.]|nr:methyltransferase domain-containing protein [Thiogranum sp.]
MNVPESVARRYSQAAQQREQALCCPVDYDATLLAMLPAEIIEKDYGCGDPSRYVREGDVVLDLGSGAGKICYMAAQLVGGQGRVIGVDINDDMLALARKYQGEMEHRLGGDRVHFVKGYIHDLRLDVEVLERHLLARPVEQLNELEALTAWKARQRAEHPLIADGSVDVVISNCVLNLVDDRYKSQLVREIYRVLRPGGRVAISDIISDEPVPDHLKTDPELWSGCISGSFQEQEFVKCFTAAGFQAVTLDTWSSAAWQVVEGIEFRSATLTAVKGTGAPCLDYGHAVIYRGPFTEVRDDEGHVFPRGERMAVCERTYKLLTGGTYRDHFIGIAPASMAEGIPWCAAPGTRRPPTESKGGRHAADNGKSGSCC